MANNNTVFGARYVGSLVGGSEDVQLNAYTVASTDAVAMFVGDFVKLTGESDIGEDGEYHPTIAQAAATDQLIGVVVGFGVNPNYLNNLYRTASTLRTAWVIDNPYALFEIQSTGTGAAADVGQCADISVGAGNTTTSLSGMQLDHGTLSSASGQLKIVRLSNVINSAFGAYTKFICLINEHGYKATNGV